MVALLLTKDNVDESVSPRISVAGAGFYHAPSHFLMNRDSEVTELPAVGHAVTKTATDAGVSIVGVNISEPYASFPHIKAMVTEELGLVERGASTQASGAESVLTTAEHGHVNGVTATVFASEI